MAHRLVSAICIPALIAACTSTPPNPPPLADDAGHPSGQSDAGANDGDAGHEPVDAGTLDNDGGTPATDGGAVTDAGTPAQVHFIAIGDTGKGNANQQKVADAMAAWCQVKTCDFVVMLGDNIYPSGVSSPDDPQFQTKFEDVYQALNIPFWVVLGNHDYGANGLGLDFAKGQHEVDYTQLSFKWTMPAKYYRHTEGPAEFFALDTNMALFSFASQQKQDVSKWIADSTAPWKIAVGHHPYLSNGPHGNAGDYDGIPIPPADGSAVKSFSEDVWCGKVDLYLSGHDHTRQWLTGTCNGTQLIVSGTGAEGTELKGKNPVYFQTVNVGFVYISIEGNALTADFVDADGNVEFTRTFTK
ncbi:MAG: metallophosphoesterase [Myxococcaceae bacterium]|nr:metallophosphoesterase [Myxococcaceae bacterium]